MRQAAIVLGLLGLVIASVGCGDGMTWGGAAKEVVYRVSAGAEKDYKDTAGATWLADQVYAEGKTWGAIGGLTVRRTDIQTIAGTKAPDVYLTERYSMTGYRFDVPNGTYTVRLHFAETFDGITKAGERVCTVKVQGEPVMKGLDVFGEAGKFATPLIKEAAGVKVTDGKLMIEFVADVQNPEINGIEILR